MFSRGARRYVLLEKVHLYAYTYDSDGNVIKTLDRKNKLLYTYKYIKGQLHQSEEYTYTDETGVEGDLKFRTEYQYTDGVLSCKTDVYANGDTDDRKEYDYHYFDDKAKFRTAAPIITSLIPKLIFALA